jgi:hypothetical protein
MKSWLSQIVIGVIVTVIGTVVANSLMRGHGRHFASGTHVSGPIRSER